LASFIAGGGVVNTLRNALVGGRGGIDKGEVKREAWLSPTTKAARKRPKDQSF
jgi:hypothetical protein